LFGNASAKVTDAASKIASATTSATGAITGGNDGDNKGGGMKWLLPLILLASIGAAAWWLINKDKNTNASAPTEQTTNSANGIPTSDATVNTTDTARVAADANKQNTAEPAIDAEKLFAVTPLPLYVPPEGVLPLRAKLGAFIQTVVSALQVIGGVVKPEIPER
jgi:hypothetical protein